MAEKKLTNELMRTFDGHGKIGAFKAGENTVSGRMRQTKPSQEMSTR